MKKSVKRMLPAILIPAGIVILALVILLVRSAKPYLRISRFVTKNESELTEIAEEILSGKTPSEKEYRGMKIDGLFQGDHPMVQFYSFGFGLVPSSTYYGFYYSPDDVPLPFQNSDQYKTIPAPDGKEEPGTTHFKGDGDNGGRTTRILPHWYYYEAWF